jgi:hypothetical protein
VYTPLGNALLKIVVSYNHEGNVDKVCVAIGRAGWGSTGACSHNRAEIVCGSVEKNMSVHFSVSAVTKSIVDADLLM